MARKPLVEAISSFSHTMNRRLHKKGMPAVATAAAVVAGLGLRRMS